MHTDVFRHNQAVTTPRTRLQISDDAIPCRPIRFGEVCGEGGHHPAVRHSQPSQLQRGKQQGIALGTRETLRTRHGRRMTDLIHRSLTVSPAFSRSRTSEFRSSLRQSTLRAHHGTSARPSFLPCSPRPHAITATCWPPEPQIRWPATWPSTLHAYSHDPP